MAHGSAMYKCPECQMHELQKILRHPIALASSGTGEDSSVSYVREGEAFRSIAFGHDVGSV